jgi:hypothetical protein
MAPAKAPRFNEQQREQLRERRSQAATIFIGFLIGLAFQEAVGPVRDSIRAHGVAFAPTVLFLVFFVRGLITFLIGYYSEVFSQFQGLRWLLRYFLFVAASVILIFMASVASVDASREARYGFIDLFFVFSVIMVLWNLVDLEWVYRTRQTEEQKRLNLWSTAMSVALVLVLLAIQWWSADRYGTGPIAILGIVNLALLLATVAALVRGELV